MQPSDKTAAVAIVSQESPLVQDSKDFALTVDHSGSLLIECT